jgi:hypothetical protein
MLKTCVPSTSRPAKIGKRRRSSIDARTTRHASYGMSQKRRKMIECIFGWGKQHGTMRKAKHRGVARIAGGFLLNLITYNLIRTEIGCRIANSVKKRERAFYAEPND